MKINNKTMHVQSWVSEEISKRITELAYKMHKTQSSCISELLVEYFKEIDYQEALKEVQRKRKE